MFSLKRDYTWLVNPDLIHRLYHGRELLRAIVRAVYADRCVVDWSNPAAPFHGVMVGSTPKQILINPTPVLEHDGEQSESLIKALHGVALHEASHAIYTSPSWMAVLRRQHQAFRRRSGYWLPQPLLLMCANLAEDIFIESKLVDEYPGFRRYFVDMRLYLFPDFAIEAQCDELAMLWVALDSDPDGLESEQQVALCRACYNTVLFLVNRDNSVANDIARVLAGGENLHEAARTIHEAGKVVKLTVRMRGAIAAADLVFQLIRTLIPESDQSETIDPERGSNPSTAATIEEALEQCPTTPLRESSSPIARQRVRGALTRKMATSLRDFENQEARKNAEEEVCSAKQIVAATALQTATGAAQLQKMSARIIDSTPDTLYEAPEYTDLNGIAARLFAPHRRQAEELRHSLDEVIRSDTKITEYGLRDGEIDDWAMADFALGIPTVFQQTQTTSEHRMDLTILIDESGSMGRYVDDEEDLSLWELAATASILLEYALRPHFGNGGIRLRVFGFTSDCFQWGETVLYRHFDSAIARLNRPWALGWSYPKHSNADGIALAAVRQEILKTKQQELTLHLLMISDGVPNAAFDYTDAEAYKHVFCEVLETQRAGIRFAHLQIGLTSDDVLEKMYGNKWQRVIRSREITRRVVEIATGWLSLPAG